MFDIWYLTFNLVFVYIYKWHNFGSLNVSGDIQISVTFLWLDPINHQIPMVIPSQFGDYPRVNINVDVENLWFP